jgi:hypothetical protein
LSFTGKKNADGRVLKYAQVDLRSNPNSESGMFLERKANPSESKKLTIKFIKPIMPIPIILQNMVQKSTKKLAPYKPSAKFPLAKVMWRISRFNPKKIPIEEIGRAHV